MNNKPRIRNFIIEIICLLFVLLFVYAAISKILDFENFRIQLGQSPILSPFASWISILIPMLEILSALFLVFQTTRFFGLVVSFFLMLLFCFYIYIILNYSSFIPCSCGGILEKMNWRQHLIFNILFTVLAGWAIITKPDLSAVEKKSWKRNTVFKRLILILLLSISSGFFMFFLFYFSDNAIHYKNRFTRRFPQHIAQEIYKIDLKYNSYYFAGSGNGKLYLGNSTAPFNVLIIDTLSRKKENIRITLEEKNQPFSGPRLRVLRDDFFVFEGSVPYVYKGSISSWHANLRIRNGYYFSHLLPMDSLNMAIRYAVPKSGESALGNLNLKDSLSEKYDTSLLEKQFDGIFDTDGSFLYNEQLERMVYVYYYRNGFVVVKPDLNLDFRGSTIDTVNHVQIELVGYKNTRMKTFARPPLMVNKTAATYGNLLFVNSTLPGLYESEKIWQVASIIDVYNLEDGTYRSSFAVYNIRRKKLRSMVAYGDFLYVLIDDKLVCYELRKRLSQDKAIKSINK